MVGLPHSQSMEQPPPYPGPSYPVPPYPVHNYTVLPQNHANIRGEFNVGEYEQQPAFNPNAQKILVNDISQEIL
jgi:hypothetical protein